ncbi:MAG: hypothetical protein OXE45_04410, partial [bacterium]|nr:hypothetical protein [bacterium]
MAIGTNFSLTGDATATAGYDIDDQVFGFKNAFSSNIKLELVAEQSSHKPDEMMSGWYGSIELNKFKIIIDHDEEETELLQTASGDPASVRSKLWVVEPEIVATLKNGPLFMRIYAAPSNKADLVAHIENDEDDDHMAEGNDDADDVGSEINKGHGITLGYDTDDLDLAIGISSEEEFSEGDEHTDSTYTAGPYAVSADLGVNVGPAKLDVSFAQGLKNNEDTTPNIDDDNTGIGAKLTTTFGDIELSGGVDVEMTGDTDNPDTTDVNEQMDWETGANAKVALTPNTKLMADFIFSTKQLVATDVEVELVDKNGLVESLDMSVKWGLFDINGGKPDPILKVDNHLSDLFVEGKLDYGLEALGGKLTPGTTVTVNQLDGSEDHTYVGLELRAVLTEAVPATTFGLKWATDRLVDSG